MTLKLYEYYPPRKRTPKTKQKYNIKTRKGV